MYERLDFKLNVPYMCSMKEIVSLNYSLHTQVEVRSTAREIHRGGMKCVSLPG